MLVIVTARRSSVIDCIESVSSRIGRTIILCFAGILLSVVPLRSMRSMFCGFSSSSSPLEDYHVRARCWLWKERRHSTRELEVAVATVEPAGKVLRDGFGRQHQIEYKGRLTSTSRPTERPSGRSGRSGSWSGLQELVFSRGLALRAFGLARSRGRAYRPETLGVRRNLDLFAPVPLAFARRFSEKPDQNQERPDRACSNGEQVNHRDAQNGDFQVRTSFRIGISNVSYTRPYSASRGSQEAVREDPGTIFRLHNMLGRTSSRRRSDAFVHPGPILRTTIFEGERGRALNREAVRFRYRHDR